LSSENANFADKFLPGLHRDTFCCYQDNVDTLALWRWLEL